MLFLPIVLALQKVDWHGSFDTPRSLSKEQLGALRSLVGETIDPHDVEGRDHFQDNGAGKLFSSYFL
jgi:hypothetical protein